MSRVENGKRSPFDLTYNVKMFHQQYAFCGELTVVEYRYLKTKDIA